MMHSFFLAGLVTIQWAVIGYSLAFGTDISSLVGGLDFFGLNGVGPEPLDGSTIPHSLFMVYQMTFAIITVALISGAFAERMKFSAFILFSLIWTTIIYDPLAHWVWGGGWIGAMGALDFAGGTVVHISSGAAALAGLQAAVVVVMVFFPVLVNTVEGLRAAEPMQRDLMTTYAASWGQSLRKLRLPAAMPFVFNGLKIATTLALIGAIVAEFFGSPIVGMGFRISTSVGQLALDMVWAEIAVAALAGSMFYGLVALIEKRVTFWHPSQRG